MLRDRYAPMQLFDLVPALELRFEPELAELDRLLDDDQLFQQVKADLARRRPHTLQTGRPSTPVEVILRLLVVQHLYQWSYEQVERFVNDSLVLRQFCRLGLEPVPHDTTLLRWANLIQAETLHRLLDRVTELAQTLSVTRGRKLRIDSTVVETTIHHPSDSGLLADGVRVLSRLVRRAGDLLARGTEPLFRDRTRSAKRLMRRIHASAAVVGRGAAAAAAERVHLYRRLLEVTRASLRQAESVQQLLQAGAGDAVQRVRAQVEHIVPLVQQVCAQARRRVLEGEAVSATDKLVSLFEPHTAVIRRGKLATPTEFGAKLLLDEVDGGLVSRYAILAGNPPDAPQLAGEPGPPSGPIRTSTPRRRGGPGLLHHGQRALRCPGRRAVCGHPQTRQVQCAAAGLGTPPSFPPCSPVPGRDRGSDQCAQAGLRPAPLSLPRPGRHGTLGRLGHSGP